MVVLVLSVCPTGLRGHVTRWLLEISPGVFVGKLSHRVRDRLWEQVVEHSRDGRAIMVYRKQGEQGLGFVQHRSNWDPIDMDGLVLIQRPKEGIEAASPSSRVSNAKRRRRFRK